MKCEICKVDQIQDNYSVFGLSTGTSETEGFEIADLFLCSKCVARIIRKNLARLIKGVR